MWCLWTDTSGWNNFVAMVSFVDIRYCFYRKLQISWFMFENSWTTLHFIDHLVFGVSQPQVLGVQWIMWVCILTVTCTYEYVKHFYSIWQVYTTITFILPSCKSLKFDLTSLYCKILYILPLCKLSVFDFDRFIQQSPMSYLQCGMVEPILRCAIAACSLDHKEANASVMKYLSDFLTCATKKEVGKNWYPSKNFCLYAPCLIEKVLCFLLLLQYSLTISKILITVRD